MNHSRNKWYSIACDYIRRYDYLSNEIPVFSPPAHARDFKMLESLWGVELPEEFVSFYSFSNGFGKRREGGNEICWFLVPILDLPEFTSMQRDFFYDSYPRVARRFMPFIKFTPDAFGYVCDESKVVTEQLWYFEDALHSNVHNKSPDYDWRYFLREDYYSSIEEYLNRGVPK